MAPRVIALGDPACPKIVGPTTIPALVSDSGYSVFDTPLPFSRIATLTRGLAVTLAPALQLWMQRSMTSSTSALLVVLGFSQVNNEIGSRNAPDPAFLIVSEAST